RDFGQLVVNRHFISGIDWAMAGAASVAAPAAPMPVTLRKSLRFMNPALGCVRRVVVAACSPARRPTPSQETLSAFLARPEASMEHPLPDFHPASGRRAQKSPAPQGDRAFSCD